MAEATDKRLNAEKRRCPVCGVKAVLYYRQGQAVRTYWWGGELDADKCPTCGYVMMVKCPNCEAPLESHEQPDGKRLYECPVCMAWNDAPDMWRCAACATKEPGHESWLGSRK